MEAIKGSSEGEDIPSDFFDDFNKDEFMDGLSVIDSWDRSDKNKAGHSRSRINARTIDSVQDLRELIGENQDDKKYYVKHEDEVDYYRSKDRSCSTNRMDDYIKPGSRRDPSKTKEAIKRDKEVKVKQYLAKHLESNDVIRPPGTELDEYYGDEDLKRSGYRKRPSSSKASFVESPPREHKDRRISPNYRFRWESPRRRMSPQRHRRHWSPRRHYDNIHHGHWSPHRSHHPHGSFKRFHKYSPRKYIPEFNREHPSRSPYKRYHRRSRSPRSIREYRQTRSRSYEKPERDYRRPHSKSPSYKTKDEHYKNSPYPTKGEIYPTEPFTEYSRPGPEYSGNVQSYPYPQAPDYSGYVPYEYGTAPAMPQPVPAPNVSMLLEQPSSAPTIVPTLVQIVSPDSKIQSQLSEAGNPPNDALAQLVAEGKLSHEDYLKLAPNKGGPIVNNSLKEEVLHRCYTAISKLDSMVLPNRLIINNELFGQEIKPIAPKFCSPLKRQAPQEFQFSKFNPSVILQQNKKIVDSIVSTLSLEKIVGITKKKLKKDVKDVGVQTTKPFCDMCVIRESTKFCSVGTCIDREQLTTTVHTQVVDQDLASSKSVFNPSGSVTDGATISIAHMTPAQLVSQLAARAKTLKQAEPQSSNQYRRNYDQDGRGQYQNYNYRY